MRLRQESVSLFFSKEEKRKLKKTAEKYNISMSECLRDMVLFGNPKAVDPLKGVDTESLCNIHT